MWLETIFSFLINRQADLEGLIEYNLGMQIFPLTLKKKPQNNYRIRER